MANKEASLLLKIKTAGEEVLDRVSESFDKIKTAGLVAFGALSAVIVKSISEYSQQEQAINALTRTMVNNGVYSKELKDAYLQQADALSKVTLFGDEQVIQAQAAFAQQARGVSLTKEATAAILDFAQAQGIDAAQAAEVVGKSIGTGTNALARYGIEVSKTATESQKMAQVLEGLNSKFGGQAQAATGGLGALQLLSKSVGELFENVGAKLAPTITFLAQELNTLINSGNGVDGFVDAMVSGFNVVAKLAISTGYAFTNLGQAIGGIIGSIVGSVELLVNGQFKAAGDALISGYRDVKDNWVKIEEENATKLKEFDAANLAAKQENFAQEEELLRQSLVRKNEIKAQDNLTQRELELQAMIEDNAIKSEKELAMLSGRQSAILASKTAHAQKELNLAVTQADKVAALEKVQKAKQLENQAKFDEAQLQARKDVFGQIATLSKSGNDKLALIGKAAALTQIAIDTPVAIGRALAAFPPPFNFAAAAAVGAAMAVQASNVAGVQLAEGGIVLPRPGGTQATIGEAGQAEAVIPLDRASEFGLGGGGGSIVINVQGGMLGSEDEARQFAIAVDRELLKLRRNNESVSFDAGVI